MRRKKVKNTKIFYWKNCVLYSIAILFSGYLVNYFLNLKPVHKLFMTCQKSLGIELLFADILHYTRPFLHLENLFFLKDWLWLIPYFLFAFIFGAIHAFIYEKRLDFKHILATCTLVYVFKLLSYSIPMKIYPIFFFFIEFVQKFGMEPLWIVLTSFLGLFVGTEYVVIWIQNSGGEELMDRYK